jgi:carbonic anhydrase/acetyltransferase-like protein (isoleucine patch superfamily)
MSLYCLASIRPRLGEEVWVAPNAVIIGDVHLADRANIWFNAVLRGDNDPIRIGRETNIQDACVLHTDAGFPLDVGDRVTVGHQVVLHSCAVGEGSLIGMGAVILNRATIGRHSIVGAHSLIPEGKTFPDRVLIVGTPGRVVRDITDAEVARLEESARHYVENAWRFRQELENIPHP